MKHLKPQPWWTVDTLSPLIKGRSRVSSSANRKRWGAGLSRQRYINSSGLNFLAVSSTGGLPSLSNIKYFLVKATLLQSWLAGSFSSVATGNWMATKRALKSSPTHWIAPNSTQTPVRILFSFLFSTITRRCKHRPFGVVQPAALTLKWHSRGTFDSCHRL